MTNSRTSKRKALQPSESMVRHSGSVEPLRIEDMVIVTSTNTLYFKRLKYIGCPKLSNGDFGKSIPKFKEGVELIDAKRDDFIRECYQLIKGGSISSAYAYFSGLVYYLVWVDDSDVVIPEDGHLAWELIDKYMNWCEQQYRLGLLTHSPFGTRRRAISWLLRQNNRRHDAKKLPSIKRGKTNTETLDLETELKPTVKALFSAYFSLLKHFRAGSIPSKHPLYDESLIEQEAKKQGATWKQLRGRKTAFAKTLRKTPPNKPIVELAMMLTYMFTGMNSTPLAEMRICDVSFREVQGGKYLFNSVKGRANYQEQDNIIGFSKHARRFIESWLDVSKQLANGDDNAYLFPYFTMDGRAISYSQTTRKPQQSINKMLKHLGLFTITPSKFRKTRSDILFRVTESVYLVAMSNNNSPEVTARKYIHGTDKEHENNLSAAMSAKYDVAKGKEIKDAVDEAKHKYGDILDNYEYQRLRQGQDRTHEARTPTGARCNDSRQGATSIIEKSLSRAGVATDKSESACTDFLSCFNCQQHTFVTDVEDIWLMLSFKDTLQQLQQTPAINSMPERKYTDLFNTVESILNGFKVKNENNYQQALEKLMDAPHPLYSTVYSLNDLLETFS